MCAFLLILIATRWGTYYSLYFLRSGLFNLLEETELRNGEAKFEITLSDYKARLFPTIRLPCRHLSDSVHKHWIIKNLITG